jgi:hypothetical protein
VNIIVGKANRCFKKKYVGPGKPATNYEMFYSESLGILQSNNLLNKTVYKTELNLLSALYTLS